MKLKRPNRIVFAENRAKLHAVDCSDDSSDDNSDIGERCGEDLIDSCNNSTYVNDSDYSSDNDGDSPFHEKNT